MRLERDRIVHNVHLPEPLRSILNRAGNRWECLARFLDGFALIVDDAPTPEWIQRSRERYDLHGETRAYHFLRWDDPLTRRSYPGDSLKSISLAYFPAPSPRYAVASYGSSCG